eukprot:GHVL01029381.1.p1 GENE.GHVL01029381.1~~GHVL01029381.1.p1  ORF type:complete len:386 (+),score=127.02 GHVL01029381.1:146-1303(+)
MRLYELAIYIEKIEKKIILKNCIIFFEVGLKEVKNAQKIRKFAEKCPYITDRLGDIISFRIDNLAISMIKLRSNARRRQDMRNGYTKFIRHKNMKLLDIYFVNWVNYISIINNSRLGICKLIKIIKIIYIKYPMKCWFLWTKSVNFRQNRQIQQLSTIIGDWSALSTLERAKKSRLEKIRFNLWSLIFFSNLQKNRIKKINIKYMLKKSDEKKINKNNILLYKCIKHLYDERGKNIKKNKIIKLFKIKYIQKEYFFKWLFFIRENIKLTILVNDMSTRLSLLRMKRFFNVWRKNNNMNYYNKILLKKIILYWKNIKKIYIFNILYKIITNNIKNIIKYWYRLYLLDNKYIKNIFLAWKEMGNEKSLLQKYLTESRQVDDDVSDTS